jgi:hypothetical protein
MSASLIIASGFAAATAWLIRKHSHAADRALDADLEQALARAD